MEILIVCLIFVCMGCCLGWILTRDKLVEMKQEMRQLKEENNIFILKKEEIENESNRILTEAKEKVEDILRNADEYARNIEKQAEIKAQKTKEKGIEAAEAFIRESRFQVNSERINKMLMDNTSVSTSKKRSSEFFDQIYADKDIPPEYLKPKIDVEFINNPFARRKVVLTGDFNLRFRSDMAEDLWLAGADIDTSISGNTNLVIIGENPGPRKMEQLEANPDIERINEDEYIRLMEMADGWYSEGDKFVGMTFFIAGKFECFTNPNLKLLIMDNGGKVSSRLTKKVDVILLGENTEAEYIKDAEESTVIFMSENELLTALGIRKKIRTYL